ncbi:MAG: response regulator [Nitrospirae bacterium]|nr:response regulator [Nitrospirota bacterium]
MADRTKILMIDDEEDFAYFVRLNLEKTGKFTVFTAPRGSEGIKLAKSEQPDLILLDLVMPEMDGGQVAAQLLAHTSTKKIPIIFLTALAQKEQVEDCDGNIGGRDYIAKPVTSEELIVRIESVLGK